MELREFTPPDYSAAQLKTVPTTGMILLGFVPLFVPILMQLFGLLTGMIQAYIFAVLAMVYIASATQIHQVSNKELHEPKNCTSDATSRDTVSSTRKSTHTGDV